jgi:hypothetical protein
MVLVPSPVCPCRCHWEDLHCHESRNSGPGTNGGSTATNVNFLLVADMPAGTTCPGTVGTTKNVYLVKRENHVGPFGSVVLVQMPAGKKASSGGAVFAKSRIDP